MDLLISMKAEEIGKGLEPNWNTMTMPTAQSGGYFIAEFRETEPDTIGFLKQLAVLVRDEFAGDSDFVIETTHFGFMIKKRVNDDIEYMEAWEKWVGFARMVYEKLNSTIEELKAESVKISKL